MFWAPLSFQKAWTRLGCFNHFKYLSNGWIQEPAEKVRQFACKLSENVPQELQID